MIDHVSVAEPAGGWREPWPQVFEIANVLPPDRWVLVGGLMVQAHAIAARVETGRVTVDVDAAVRVEAGVYGYASAAGSLIRLGYTFDDSTTRAYQFRRGKAVTDLIVADHERPPTRFARRMAMSFDGGHQALARATSVTFQRGEEAAVDVPLPSLHGALVVKSAAHLVDSRDRARHLLDVITLLACVIDTEAMVDDLRGSDRKRLVHLVRAFESNPVGSGAGAARHARPCTADDRRPQAGASPRLTPLRPDPRRPSSQ